MIGNSLAFQLLGLHASTAGGTGSQVRELRSCKPRSAAKTNKQTKNKTKMIKNVMLTWRQIKQEVEAGRMEEYFK